MSTRPLHLNSFPLHGSQLIEASAGTGKTFTIALLYTRLIIQHGGEAAFSDLLTPEQILVVTFTDAATQELKDRIRARLVEAAACFRADPASITPDSQDPLHSLRDEIAPERWSHCARLLTQAAQGMDQAAIATIHGWCYRILREYAFDSGNLFNQTLISDQTELLHELIRDYWRRHFYPLSGAEAEAISACFASPDALLTAVKPLLNQQAHLTYAGHTLQPPASLPALLAEEAARRSRIEALEKDARSAWAEDAETLRGHLITLRKHLNLSTYSEAKDDATFAQLLDALDDWSLGGPAPVKMQRFAAGNWRLKGGQKAPAQPKHPALDALASWTDACAASEDKRTPDLQAHLLVHATQWMQLALERRLREQAELGFDDLLTRLDQALASPQGEALATQIRQRFPVAMIDEFQDTDPVQYRIFNRIYAVGESGTDRALIMIGDPKQAIYSFRGADIHTYLQAREATQGRHHNLTRNFRSSVAVVEAVNTLFSHAETHEAGAFRFRTSASDPLPFIAVDAAGRTEQLRIGGHPAAALTFWHLQGDDAQQPVSLSDYRQQMAAACASEICTWLQAPKQNGFDTEQGWKPLRPADMAILVRGRTEAELIRSALQARGLASVYLSDRESVFKTAEARDLLYWLRACADPADDRRVRAALATPSLARTLAELDQLQRDEWLWEQETLRFRHFHQLWRSQGVLPMLQALLHSYQLPARVLQHPQGERTLTNLLHLSEWLQRASTEQDGELGLIRHFAEQVQQPDGEEILRLESDDDLIRVVTIHKSKGLEYPLVLLPFICSFKAVDGKTRSVTLSHTQADGQLSRRVEIAGNKVDAQAWTEADQARLNEDLRLLYVALTRARHALWLGVAAIKVGNGRQCLLHQSALGYLLAGGEAVDADGLQQGLNHWRDRCPHIALAPAPAIHDQRYQTPHRLDDQPARHSPRSPYEHWWIASYSAISLGAHGDARAEPESALDERQAEQLDNPAASRSFSRQAPGLHGFVRGPAAGTFLHGLLEWAAEQGFAAALSADAARRQLIAQRCRLRGWSAESERVDAWLADFLGRRFELPDGSQLQLSTLHTYQAELEFLLASARFSTSALDQLCQHWLHPGRPRPALKSNLLNGMLKGFIDLVFEHQGRYYVADWKSNHLGRDDAAYTPDALIGATLEKRYDVQYALYLLALHRLLRQRLPDYSVQQHLGGALYFYLRGSQSASGGVFMDRPDPHFIEALDQLFVQGHSSEEIA